MSRLRGVDDETRALHIEATCDGQVVVQIDGGGGPLILLGDQLAAIVHDECSHAPIDTLAGSGGPLDVAHRYLSTACLHAAEIGRERLHGRCSSLTRIDGGGKIPARCKWCPSPCVCPCHSRSERVR